MKEVKNFYKNSMVYYSTLYFCICLYYTHLQEMLFGKTEEDESSNGIDFMLLYQHAADNFQIAKAMLGKK
jgi:hypothetical protein